MTMIMEYFQSQSKASLALGFTGTGIILTELTRKPFQPLGIFSWSLLFGMVAGGSLVAPSPSSSTSSLSTGTTTVCFVTMGLGWCLKFATMYAFANRNSATKTNPLQQHNTKIIVQSGPYGVVRHPAYVSFVLAFSPAALIVSSNYYYFASVFGVTTWLYGVFLADMEERQLFKLTPTIYRQYQSKVPYKLFPGIY